MVANHPIQERIPAPFTPWNGDTLISYFAHHGNQRKRTGATERHFPTIEVGQKLKLGGAKSSSSTRKSTAKSTTKTARLHRHQRHRNLPGRRRATLLVMANDRESYHAVFDRMAAIKGLIFSFHEVHLFTPRCRKRWYVGNQLRATGNLIATNTVKITLRLRS